MGNLYLYIILPKSSYSYLKDATSEEILEQSPDLELKSTNLKCIGEFLDYVEKTCNIYSLWNVKCILHIHFLATDIQYTRQGLALALTEFALDYGRRLMITDSMEHNELPKHLQHFKPEVAVASFTTTFTQKIGQKLGFTEIFIGEYDKFHYGEVTFAQNIDNPEQKCSIFSAKRL